jgi:hypothetical protein
MPSLWEALHGTYNSASGQGVAPDVLEDFAPAGEWEWPPFSDREVREALALCSAQSAPGPDHITWWHLKKIMPDPAVGKVFLALANACMEHGHWPSYFKVSNSVIIPKPGKPSYQSPRAFQPIVLLNTLGKLIEKMISTCLQFDGVKFELFLPHQFGGIRQRSTEDAGLFLTHLVHAGWAKGLKTSIVAFNVAQFFPSINHEMLLAVMACQGFPDHVRKFFSSYLVGRETSYC